MAPVHTKTKKRAAPSTKAGPPSKKIILAGADGDRTPADKAGKKRSRPVTAPLVEDEDEDDEDEDDEGDDLDDAGEDDDVQVADEAKAPKDPNGVSAPLHRILTC
jgi:pumilio family protein 6